MPQKTKKEKQIAELRRKLLKQSSSLPLQSSSASPKPSTSTPEKKSGSYSFPLKTQQNPVKDLPSQIIAIDPNYYTRDLRKTFILTVIVFSVELLLYWALEIKGIKF